ncbi:MAG: hypothetical protein FWG68_09905 [Defluviitaleaceae bacterium]|nr:hypothetical protein [Defluviitaleaceae bacterium]
MEQAKVTRYDGTRVISLDEIDKEFDGGCVLIDTTDFLPKEIKGYLLASAKGKGDSTLLLDLKHKEYMGMGVMMWRGNPPGRFDDVGFMQD